MSETQTYTLKDRTLCWLKTNGLIAAIALSAIAIFLGFTNFIWALTNIIIPGLFKLTEGLKSYLPTQPIITISFSWLTELPWFQKAKSIIGIIIGVSAILVVAFYTTKTLFFWFVHSYIILLMGTCVVLTSGLIIWLITNDANVALSTAFILTVFTALICFMETLHKADNEPIDFNFKSMFQKLKENWKNAVREKLSMLETISILTFGISATVIAMDWLARINQSTKIGVGYFFIVIFIAFCTGLIASKIHNWLDPLATHEVIKGNGNGKSHTVIEYINQNEADQRLTAYYILSWAPLYSSLIWVQTYGVTLNHAAVGFAIGCFAFSALGFFFPCRESLGTLIRKKLGWA